MKMKMNMKMKMKIVKMKMKMNMKMMMTQWIKAKKTKIIKENNGNLDKIIDKSKSFEEQIELLKKLEDLNEYWYYKDYNDKELKSKYFKIKLADMSNKIDEKFEEILNFNKNENENENDETLMA